MPTHPRVRPTAFAIAFLLACLAAAATAADLPERCRLQPVNGECKARMERYRFDPEKGRCVEYTYDGCGPVVPFETAEECRALCESLADPPADAKPERASSGLARDPVEDDPRYADAFRSIDGEVKAEMAASGDTQRRGSVYRYWAIKKRILKTKYGIDWRDPGEMNPHVIFD